MGKNYRDILRLKKITELYDLLFPGERTEAPEKGLSTELERRITRSSIRSMTYVLDILRSPVPILLHILRKYEYQNVKTLARGMASGHVDATHMWDLGKYATLRYEAGQDPEKSLAASSYAWVVAQVKSTPIAKVENSLDREYYRLLQSLALDLPSADRVGVLRMIMLQVTLANVIWALRLRFYFRMDWERARDLLIPGMHGTRLEPLARIFEIAPDAVEEWKTWKYGWLLEDQFGDSFHAPDPMKAELSCRQMLYTKARQLFHQNPFSLGPLVAYFTLKDQEASLLTTAVEVLQLSLPEQEVLAIVGAR